MLPDTFCFGFGCWVICVGCGYHILVIIDMLVLTLNFGFPVILIKKMYHLFFFNVKRDTTLPILVEIYTVRLIPHLCVSQILSTIYTNWLSLHITKFFGWNPICINDCSLFEFDSSMCRIYWQCCCIPDFTCQICLDQT